ncbi:LuxR C-terminal-related transcriptional regulator [Kitasatospora sp. NPDC051705]|uniref:LuxR C-terminal-related transcriptional regulator n=1 Tax=Kitasatospora sp. NPDC051705 TaxID=3364057 RepID=UPI003797732A
MTTPPTAEHPAGADSPTPGRRPRKPRAARADQDTARLLRKLTPREAQALGHLATGRDLPQTAAALGVTPATARSYVQRAMRKLGAATEAEAVALTAGLRAPQTSPPAAPPATSAAPAPAPARPPGPAVPPADGAGRAPVLGTGGRPKENRAPAPDGHRPQPSPGERPGGAPPGTGRRRTPPRSASSPAPAAPSAAPAPAEPGNPPTSTGKPAPVKTATPTAPTTAPTEAPATAGRQTTAPTGTAPTGTGPARAGRRPRAVAGATGPGAPARAGEPAPAGPADRGGRGEPAPARAAEQPVDAPAPAPAGSATAAVPRNFEELYEAAHTRLVQQVFLLTTCRHRAVHCVRLAFGQARREWEAVAASGNPEGWVRVRACELGLSPWHRGGPRRSHLWSLPHRRITVRPADESQAVLPDHDRLTDRDRALLKALRRLSRPQRRALVLHDGLGLPAAAVSVEVESTLAAAEGRVWAARAALAQSVPDLVGPDPTAPGFADRLSGLLHRAAVRGCPEPHRAPVPVLRARHRLWSASRTGAAAALTVAVGGAVLATLVGIRPAALFREPEPPEPAVCVPAPDADEPGVPVLPGGPPNGVRSLWCSPTPGIEAVVVEPRTEALARWELPAAARGAGAPPPQGPAACPLWSPLPCTTGPAPR